MPAGRVRRWHTDKGFGFITPNDGTPDIFCHASDLLEGDGSVKEGTYVLYTIKYDDRKGKERAAEVEATSATVAGFQRDGSVSCSPEREESPHCDAEKASGGSVRPVIDDIDPADRKFPTNNPDAGVGTETGKMVKWDKEKNFGFIKPDSTGPDLFCHLTALVAGAGSVVQGDRVTYTKEFNLVKNKWLALNVRVDTENDGKDTEKVAPKKVVVEKRGGRSRSRQSRKDRRRKHRTRSRSRSHSGRRERRRD